MASFSSLAGAGPTRGPGCHQPLQASSHLALHTCPHVLFWRAETHHLACLLQVANAAAASKLTDHLSTTHPGITTVQEAVPCILRVAQHLLQV